MNHFARFMLDLVSFVVAWRVIDWSIAFTGWETWIAPVTLGVYGLVQWGIGRFTALEDAR